MISPKSPDSTMNKSDHFEKLLDNLASKIKKSKKNEKNSYNIPFYNIE